MLAVGEEVQNVVRFALVTTQSTHAQAIGEDNDRSNSRSDSSVEEQLVKLTPEWHAEQVVVIMVAVVS